MKKGTLRKRFRGVFLCGVGKVLEKLKKDGIFFGKGIDKQDVLW